MRKNYPLADVVCYLPFDTRRRVREFLDLAQPSVAIFIKYEFWANYLFELKRREIPTYIISAIFRPEQPFFRWYGAPFRPLLHCYTHLYIQDDASKQLLEKAGIQGNVTVTGDTRYDRVWEIRRAAKEIPEVESLLQAADGERVRTLVAGSSWPQDEEILIPYFNARPELKLIIAPHEIHEEHLRSIEAMLKRPALRLSAARGKDLRDYSCLIIDCFGLLSSVYRYGEIAYIGGGFGVGIHNTLEAAVYDIPVIFGPEYRKFREACDLVECGGGFAVHSQSEFTAKMDELLSMPDHLRAAGKADRHAGESSLKRSPGQDLRPLLRRVHIDFPAPHAGDHHKGAKAPVGNQRHGRPAELRIGHLIALGIEPPGLGRGHQIGGTGNALPRQVLQIGGPAVIGQHHCQRCRRVFLGAGLQDQLHTAYGLTFFHQAHTLSPTISDTPTASSR